MYQDFDFDTTAEYTKEIIKNVQKRLLEMSDIVTRILSENGFKYMITFGTLLGSIRHSGFIPWDDDFDLFLFDNEYNDAIECLRENLPNDLIVHDRKSDSIYWPSWSRIRDLKSYTESTLFEDDNHYKYRGINLDLYRLEMFPQNMIKVNTCRERIRYYSSKYCDGLLCKEKYFEMIDCWSKQLSAEIENSKNNKNNRIVYCWKYLYDIELEYEDIFPLKEYIFENRKFYGPNNYDKLLKKSYNNYLQLPSKEKRKPHYSKVIFY